MCMEIKDVVFYNGEKFKLQTDERNYGYYRSTRHIDGERKMLHRYKWELNNGEIPPNHHIHHKDENVFNNNTENLKCLYVGEHAKKHNTGNEWTEEQKERQSKLLKKMFNTPEMKEKFKKSNGGTNNSQAKVTKKEGVNIFKEYSNTDKTYKEMSKKYGYSVSVINKIVNNKHWTTRNMKGSG